MKVGASAQAFMPLRLPWRINPRLLRISAKRLVGLRSASASWVRSENSDPPRIRMPSNVSDRVSTKSILLALEKQFKSSKPFKSFKVCVSAGRSLCAACKEISEISNGGSQITHEYASEICNPKFEISACWLGVPRWLHFTEQPADDVEGRESFALRLEVGEDPVAEHRGCEGLNIFNRNCEAALENRARLRAQDQILRNSRAGTPLDVIPDELRSVSILRAGFLCQGHGVGDNKGRH